MGLPRSQRQSFFHQGAQRKLVDEPCINAGAGDASSAPRGHDDLPDHMPPVGAQKRGYLDLIPDVIGKRAVRFQPHTVDAGIRPHPAGHIPQCLVDLGFLEIDDLRVKLARQFQTVQEMVDRDHPLRSHQERGLHRE